MAVALPAGLGDLEQALLEAHLTVPVTGRTGLGLRSGLGPATGATFTADRSRYRYLFLGSLDGLGKIYFEVATKVVAGNPMTAPAATAPTSTEEITEQVPENILEHRGIPEPARETSETGRLLEGGMTKTVVSRTFLGIGQDLVGLAGLFETGLGGFLVVRVAVGVVLERELAIALLYIIGRSVAPNAEYLVIIALGHSSVRIIQSCDHSIMTV